MTGQISGLATSETADDFRRLHFELPPRSSTFVVFRPHSQAALKAQMRFQTESLTTSWRLSFPDSSVLPAVHMSEPISWTAWPQTECFSGTGTYTTVFEWNRPVPRRAFLQFSRVHEAADVRVNGQLAGSVWTPPYEVDITSSMRPGTNSLSINVANLPLNAFLGTPDQDLGALRAAYGDRFPAPEEKKICRLPFPSGLVGPVRIRFSLD
jgi:hypothetical protein